MKYQLYKRNSPTPIAHFSSGKAATTYVDSFQAYAIHEGWYLVPVLEFTY